MLQAFRRAAMSGSVILFPQRRDTVAAGGIGTVAANRLVWQHLLIFLPRPVVVNRRGPIDIRRIYRCAGWFLRAA